MLHTTLHLQNTNKESNKVNKSYISLTTPIISTPDFVASDDRVAPGSNLNSGVQVVEDVIILQFAMSIIVEIDTWN